MTELTTPTTETKLLLLDCDGTLREPISGGKFINDPKDQKLIDGVEKAIAHFTSKGYKCICITNQGGVAAGKKSLLSAIEEQHYTLSLLPALDCIYFCPSFDGEVAYYVNRQETKQYKHRTLVDDNDLLIPGLLIEFGVNLTMADIEEFSIKDIQEVKHKRLIEFDSFRKPGAGMLQLAIAEHYVTRDFEEFTPNIWMIGDRPEDYQAAANAKVNFIWSDKWRNTDWGKR